MGPMFFLLRLAFWLGLVLVLLPTGARQTTSTSNIDASDALSAASATVHDVKGFCSREPNACTIGAQIATVIGYRAQAGAKMLYDLLTEAMAPRQTGVSDTDAGKSAPGRSALERASQDTLRPADLNPSWRGPPARASGKHSA